MEGSFRLSQCDLFRTCSNGPLRSPTKLQFSRSGGLRTNQIRLESTVEMLLRGNHITVFPQFSNYWCFTAELVTSLSNIHLQQLFREKVQYNNKRQQQKNEVDKICVFSVYIGRYIIEWYVILTWIRFEAVVNLLG